jgi:hypothetical protein
LLKAFSHNFDAWVLTQVLTSLLDVSLALFAAVFGLVVQDGSRPWFGKENLVKDYHHAADVAESE